MSWVTQQRSGKLGQVPGGWRLSVCFWGPSVCHVASLLPFSLPLPSSISLTMWKQQSSPFPLWGPQAALPSLHFRKLTPCSGRGVSGRALATKSHCSGCLLVLPRGCVGQQKALTLTCIPEAGGTGLVFARLEWGESSVVPKGTLLPWCGPAGPPEPAGIICGSLHSRAARVA